MYSVFGNYVDDYIVNIFIQIYKDPSLTVHKAGDWRSYRKGDPPSHSAGMGREHPQRFERLPQAGLSRGNLPQGDSGARGNNVSRPSPTKVSDRTHGRNRRENERCNDRVEEIDGIAEVCSRKRNRRESVSPLLRLIIIMSSRLQLVVTTHPL